MLENSSNEDVADENKEHRIDSILTSEVWRCWWWKQRAQDGTKDEGETRYIYVEATH